jgi:hypothetical protein
VNPNDELQVRVVDLPTLALQVGHISFLSLSLTFVFVFVFIPYQSSDSLLVMCSDYISGDKQVMNIGYKRNQIPTTLIYYVLEIIRKYSSN